MDYVPERIIKADNILNKVILGLNIVFPLLACSFTFVYNLQEENGIKLWVYLAITISFYLTFLLQVASGIFLFYALFKIERFITKEDKGLVNVKKWRFTQFHLDFICSLQQLSK